MTSPISFSNENGIGLPRVVQGLRRYGAGDRFGDWTPARLLVELAGSGQRVSDWRLPT